MNESLLTVERYDFGPALSWTVSKFFIHKKQYGFTIEDKVRNGVKVHGETAIPFGRYPLSHRLSPKFSKNFLWSEKAQRLIPNPLFQPKLFKSKSEYFFLKNNYGDWKEHNLIWVTDVPKYQYILIHWGNFITDTEGCLVVGETEGYIGKQRAVLNSKVQYIRNYEVAYPIVAKGNQYIDITKRDGL